MVGERSVDYVISVVAECRLVKALCESNWSRAAHAGVHLPLIRVVGIQDQFSVGLDIGAARLRDEVSDTFHSSVP